ncbi:MAG: hypothetical protein ISS17_06045 [Bacteroidales bacterium]|nr:hypothetical protein [Bacteroidales bacterium]
MRIGKYLLLFMILLLLVLPFIQRHIPLVKERKLVGFFRLAPSPSWQEFTWKRWFHGEFQDQMTGRVEEHIGFRKSLFRLHNEFDFRLFRISHAEGFICGKEDNMFEEDYILEYTGKYFIGEETWNTKLEKLAEVKTRLSSMGTELILVLEPGKASFSPEFIPVRYLAHGTSLSNYTYVTHWLDAHDVPYLDLNRWFIQAKDTSRFPLFPKYGMHWSLYAVPLVVDTLSRYIELATGTTIPALTIQRIEISDSLQWTDRDIADLLNLIFPLPSTETAYPVVSVEPDSIVPHLKALVIADSYYLNIKHGYSPKLFAGEEYWYYNSKLYPHIEDDREPVYVDKSNLQEKLLQFDVVLLMVSEINLHCGFWNFADEAYQAFSPDHQDPPWYPYENMIRNQREWFRYMVKKAENNFNSLENTIRMDAKFLYNTENH